jgi:hypothetical protein
VPEGNLRKVKGCEDHDSVVAVETIGGGDRWNGVGETVHVVVNEGRRADKARARKILHTEANLYNRKNEDKIRHFDGRQPCLTRLLCIPAELDVGHLWDPTS